MSLEIKQDSLSLHPECVEETRPASYLHNKDGGLESSAARVRLFQYRPASLKTRPVILTRFKKICHPSQRPRWQVDKEAIGLSRVQQCSSTCNPPEICVNLVFKHIHAASNYTIS